MDCGENIDKRPLQNHNHVNESVVGLFQALEGTMQMRVIKLEPVIKRQITGARNNVSIQKVS